MNAYKKLEVDSVTKTVPDRIYSLAIHPSRDRILVASGDSWGRYNNNNNKISITT